MIALGSHVEMKRPIFQIKTLSDRAILVNDEMSADPFGGLLPPRNGTLRTAPASVMQHNLPNVGHRADVVHVLIGG